MKAQTNLFDEIIVDNFAGGGGASTGIEFAIGRPVNIAINHDPDAILMHKTNHPYTQHYCESVWDIDPVKVCSGRPVGLAWFSPDCKHFSKAKGGKPVDKNIRGLSWVILRWMLEVGPRVIMMENVEEIMTWGPLIQRADGTSYPDMDMQGETFKGFIAMMSTGIEPSHPAFVEACDCLKISACGHEAKRLIKGLGYAVDYRILKAADYGAPTIRKRFFLVARCDGSPIVWPEPTHNRDGSGGKDKWRSAAEIIDWSLPCPSIFATREEIKKRYRVNSIRPLANNTLRRVARGIQKFVIDNPQPFIVQVNHGGGYRGQNTTEPLQTITAKHGYGIVDPLMAPWTVTNTTNSTGHSVNEPIDTARTGGGGGQMFVTPIMTAIGQTGFGSDRSRAVTDPVNTTVSKAESCLVSPALIQYHTEKKNEYVRGQAVAKPIMTTDAANRYATAAAYMTEYYGAADRGFPISEPTHTATSKDREGLALAFMSKYYAGGYNGKGNTPGEPLNTITACDHNAIAAAFVSKFYKTGVGQSADEPLHTVTLSAGHFGEVRTRLVKYDGCQKLHHWPEVRELLNTYCGYSMADDDILILEFAGTQWFISDIGLRMLIPRELYAANGFPPDYIIDRDYKGNVYGKTKQVARCGNAVPPPFATALVRANLPEWCDCKITTMAEFERQVAI